MCMYLRTNTSSNEYGIVGGYAFTNWLYSTLYISSLYPSLLSHENRENKKDKIEI